MPTFKYFGRTCALRSALSGRVSLMHLDPAVIADVLEILRCIGTGCNPSAKERDRVYQISLELRAVMERDGVSLDLCVPLSGPVVGSQCVECGHVVGGPLLDPCEKCASNG